MSLGTLLLAGAVFLFFWNQNEDRKANEASQEIIYKIAEEIEENEKKEIKEEGGKFIPYEKTMPEKEIDGNGYIGCLFIPSLGLELPVMSEWDYAKLRVAPCRYGGSTVTEDLVIAAHNYTSHFGKLKELNIGEIVKFMDMNGKIHQYEVAEVNVLEPTDIEEMINGEFSLSLFTCTYGGQSRLTVRCIEIK